MNAKQVYLAAYNTMMAACWAALAVQVLQHSISQQRLRAPDSAFTFASALQWLSILETVHAAAGIVRSDVASNVMQWVARAHAILLVVAPEPQLRENPWAAVMLVAWGVGETCRYPKCACLCDYSHGHAWQQR